MEIREAIERIKDHKRIHFVEEYPRAIKITEALDMAIDALEEKDTGDYIKIVRCKDCAVSHNKWTGCPKIGGLVTPPDFYCGFGVPEITEDIL